jgi:putative ABC transport system permease protein
METFFQDVRYAFRTLRKSPVFTVIAVVCLSLGIATNTTLFSIFDSILLRPFPFERPEQLVYLQELNPKNGDRASIGYLNFLDWRAQARSFSDMGGYSGRSLAITEGEEPERLQGQLVTWSLFPMLGVKPQVGRRFREDEDKPGAAGTVLLGDGVWKRRYASDSSVVGRVVSINNLPYTVVGVMPPRFQFPQTGDIWVPMAPFLHDDKRNWRGVQVIGRMKSGVEVRQADREIAGIAAAINRQYVLNDLWIGNAIELRKNFMPDDVRLVTAAMMGAVTFVLLIACANVANLMLTRAAGRSREIAIRAVIGAGRGRIVRQLLTESVILALAAGIVAVPLTWEGLRLVDLAIPVEDPIPYYIHWSLDVPTLLYTAAVSVLTGVLFGLAPALSASRGRLHEALKDGGRSGGGSVRRNRLRSALVVAEVALSLVLLVGASLFVRSFFAMQHAQIGFDPAPIMTMRIYLPGERYDSTYAKAQRVQDILQRVEALPGVHAATISNLIPIDGGGAGDGVIIEGQTVEKGKEPFLFWTGVAGHWFETLGVPLVRGRTFSESELRDSVPVAVINYTMANRFWQSGDPVGHRFQLAGDSSRTWFSVIGVAADIRTSAIDDEGTTRPTAYLPYRFLPARNHGVMVRVRGVPTSITNAVRGAIRASDPAIPVFRTWTMDKVRELSFWQFRLFGVMFGVFGGIALFLAAIGVYGVISYGVSQRTREIGVRVALGAQQRHVIRLVVRQGMLLAGVGIAVGLVGSFGVTRVVASLLHGVSPTDPVSFAGVALFLTAVAFVASFIPARRATEVDPIVALRFE